MLKEGDIVMCVDADRSKLARRHLLLGEIYEVTQDETRVSHGVRVRRAIICCEGHKEWITTTQDISWRADRFKKLGRVQ